MKEKLNPFHVAILIYMIQTGVVIFSLPRMLAQYIGYNGWISVLLFYAFITLNIMLISLVYRLCDGKSIFQIIEQTLPKIIYYPLYMVLIVAWSLTGSLIAKEYIIIYQSFVFPTTHPMFIKIFVDILAYLLVIKGIYNITKAATMFFALVIWTIMLLLFFINNFQFLNFTSFYFREGTGEFSGFVDILSAFLGYELVLLLFPFAEKGKKLMKAVHYGNLLTTSTYLLVSFVCYGFYSFEQLKRMKYPVIELLAYIELPFVERIEQLIFSLYLFTALIGHVLYMWAATKTAKQALPNANMKWTTIIIFIIAYAISWIPDVLMKVEIWLTYLGQLDLTIALGLPLLLILLLLFRKRSA